MSRRIDPEPPSVWPKNLVPPPKSRYENLKIRHELLVPEVLPEKALATSGLSNPDILYGIDKPVCSLNDQEAVSPASQSSHTVVGDSGDDMVGNSTHISPGLPSELRCHEDGQWSSNFINQLVEATYHHPNIETIELSSTITESSPPPQTPPPHTPSPLTPPSHTPPPLMPPPLSPPPLSPPPHTPPPHTLPPHTPPSQALSPRTPPPHALPRPKRPRHTVPPPVPDGTRRKRSRTTITKQSNLAPAQSLDAYIHLPKDEDIHDDDGHSSDHYTSSEVSECWKEKRTRHFRETMFPNREKKYKVGTSAYLYSFNDLPSTPPEVLATRDPRTFMSGALQSEERSPSHDITSTAGRSIKSIKASACAKVAPLCICRTTIPGAERYGGHYHAVNGISVRNGKIILDCVRLCSKKSEDIVNIEFSVLQKECPRLTEDFLSRFAS